jgi:kynureninase
MTVSDLPATGSGSARRSWFERAAVADADDPIGRYRAAFVDAPGVVAYLDGNSLGRPLRATADRLAEFVWDAWGTRLIRSWDEGWMDEPTRLGDELARVVLGAAPGQTVVGDSTTVLLYKAARAALAARPGRHRVVCSAADFPTDRFLLQGLADELGLRLAVLDPAEHGSLTAEELAPALDDDTALVLLSHVAFRSGHIADAAGLTDLAHRADAVVVWDLSHAAGVVPLELDAWQVDLAVGCGYKYLNGGPGAPAFLYATERLLPELRQPVQGWMGSAEPFRMGERYEPAPGIRRFLSGTPPIVGMLPLADMLALIDAAGLPAVRAKSQALTAFAIDYADEELAGLGVRLASPRDAEHRGSHVTLDHPAFAEIVPVLQRRGVVPDFRHPDGLRIGLSPLSTSFAELAAGLEAVREELLARS